MTKKIFLTIGAILLLIILSIFYLSTVGIETTKFNKFIKKEIKLYNNKSDIILKKVKLKLNLDNLFININTFDPVVTLNSTKTPLEKYRFKSRASVSPGRFSRQCHASMVVGLYGFFYTSIVLFTQKMKAYVHNYYSSYNSYNSVLN